ncbi:MAG: PTS galactitol transporter subunit IIB [Firmicutes bacterium]|nr:PTS galactitol transporter subunit IIB [Bacillota bacterium]
MPAKILVASGTSKNRMNTVAELIRKLCADRGVEVECKAENLWEVNLEAAKPDVIVVIGPERLQTSIPVVRGIPFLTRMGMDKAIDEILKHVK